MTKTQRKLSGEQIVHNFQQIVLGQLNVHMQKSDFNSYSTSYSKVNSKWIMELNVKLKTETSRRWLWVIWRFLEYDTNIIGHERKIVYKVFKQFSIPYDPFTDFQTNMIEALILAVQTGNNPYVLQQVNG